jgi:hypothetical protein
MRFASSISLLLLVIGSLALAQEGRQEAEGEIEIIEGIMLDPAAPLATMAVEKETIVLHLGPVWFWEENDFFLEEGEELVVEGEVERVDGIRHVYPNKLVLRNRTIELASESGIPLWSRGAAGRGRGAGRNTDSDHGGPRGYGRGRASGSGDDWRR